MVRQSRFGQDLFIRHGGYRDHSLVSASDSRSAFGAIMAGDGPPGGLTGEPGECGSVARPTSRTVQRSLTVAAITVAGVLSTPEAEASLEVEHGLKAECVANLNSGKGRQIIRLPTLHVALALHKVSAECDRERSREFSTVALRGTILRAGVPALVAATAAGVEAADEAVRPIRKRLRKADARPSTDSYR